MQTVENLILRFLYIGNIPYAPGTICSLFIAVIWYFVPNNLYFQLIIIFLFILIGGIMCYRFSLKNGHTDPGYIVIDEAVGMIISLIMIPKTIPCYILALVLFRFLDIIKPSFIYHSQLLKGGFGIMIDDILAGIITALIIHGFFLW